MANSASVELADARILIRDDPEGAARLLVALVAAVAELTERVARLEGRSSQNTQPAALDGSAGHAATTETLRDGSQAWWPAGAPGAHALARR